MNRWTWGSDTVSKVPESSTEDPNEQSSTPSYVSWVWLRMDGSGRKVSIG